MNNLQTFNHEMFGQLPVIIVNKTEWFGTTEAAKALSFSNPYDAIKNHIDEDDLAVHEVIDKLGRKQQKKFTNESGLYSLIFGASNQGNNLEIKAKAKKFKRWVTSEILPTIRKTGGYVANDDLFIETYLPQADEQTKLLFRTTLKTVRKQNDEIAKLKPKALFADAVETSESSVLIGELAKILKQNGIDIGQNRLFAWLRENGYLIRQKGESYNLPTQRSMDMELFEIKKRTINNPDGSVRVTRTTKVTGKGQIYFVNKFLKQQEVV